MAFVEDLRGPWWLNDAYYRLLAGGWGKPAAPGQGNLTDAWVFGGGTNTSGPITYTNIDRMTFSNDTVMTSKGNLSIATKAFGAASNVSDTWTMGGLKTNIQRTIHATDSNNSLIRSYITGANGGPRASGNSTDGWVLASGNGTNSVVDRITYASDNTLASRRGNLNRTRHDGASTGNEEMVWIAGGSANTGNGAPITDINRVIYSNDTSISTTRGPLGTQSIAPGASGNTTDGWFLGGVYSPSAVQRIIFANDTVTATNRATMSYSVEFGDASGNLTDLWLFNGNVSLGGFGGDALSLTSRLTFANDTTTPSIRGNANYTRTAVAASS